MTNLALVSLFTLAGISAVTLIDTLGAIASRKLNFYYGWLTILSLLVYTFTAYFISARTNFSLAFLANCIIGLYDATVGWKLALALNANIGMTAEEIEDTNLSFRLIAMLIISFGFSYLGFFIQERNLI